MATAAERRKAQNRGVKHGAVRVGAKGKTVRKYNSKTGRWDVTAASVKSYKAAVGQKSRPKSQSPSSSVSRSTAIKKGVEGPKTSRSENYNRVGFRVPGSRGTINKVTVNKPSDFSPNSKLQLVKQKGKDSRGRDVYRWVKMGNQ